MSDLRGRLGRVERQLGISASNASNVDAPERALWSAFYEYMQGVLSQYPVALDLVRHRCGINNSVVWSSSSSPDSKLWVMVGTFWSAVEGFPDAHAAAQAAMGSFGEMLGEVEGGALDDEDCVDEETGEASAGPAGTPPGTPPGTRP